MGEVTVVVTTEFGRTIKENGDLGTDHGLGSSSFVLGNSVTGGVYGAEEFSVVPTSTDKDIGITTDHRTIFAEIMTKRGGVSDPANLVSTVFPTWSHSPTNELGILS